jgi:FkbM family methyltransferase
MGGFFVQIWNKGILRSIRLKLAGSLLQEQKNQLYQDLAEINRHGHLYYSQEGEDILLNRYFHWKKEGFFIDVGAHHPQRFSNTYFFYKLGWRGINIDAMPGSMVPFQELRPEDINIEQPVSDEEAELTYHIFSDPALNGFSAELSAGRNTEEFFLKEKILLRTRRLADILKEHVPTGRKIDFLSVDVEGLDLQVLRSNDWNLYRPEFVLVECLKTGTLSELEGNETAIYLKNLGYKPVSKLMNTVFFRSSDSIS